MRAAHHPDYPLFPFGIEPADIKKLVDERIRNAWKP